MFRELHETKQVEGEPLRKWYFSDDMDLVVWFDPAGAPCAFQLAYDKYECWYEGQFSISWHQERGYQHYKVIGDGSGYGYSGTPFLQADGTFNREAVLERFLGLSEELPSAIVELVAEKLRVYSG